MLWLRVTKGMSQLQVADGCGVERQRYYMWESGRTSKPQRHNMEGLREVFGLSDWNELVLEPSQEPDRKFVTFYREHRDRTGSVKDSIIQRQVKRDYELVAFDADGVLVTGFGFDFSNRSRVIRHGRLRSLRRFGASSSSCRRRPLSAPRFSCTIGPSYRCRPFCGFNRRPPNGMVGNVFGLWDRLFSRSLCLRDL